MTTAKYNPKLISNTIKQSLALLLVSLSFVFTGCISSSSLLSTINSANQISVYEGLPHQFREAELLEQEKLRSDIVMIAGFPFYEPSVKANNIEEKRIKRLLGNGSNFFKGVPKDCGPFHPDFSVEWMDKGSKHQILVCFGCKEVMVVSNKTKETYDFKRFAELEQILSKFSSKRPSPGLD